MDVGMRTHLEPLMLSLLVVAQLVLAGVVVVEIWRSPAESDSDVARVALTAAVVCIGGSLLPLLFLIAQEWRRG